MPPAYLRAPSALKAEAEVFVPGCTDRARKLKKEAQTSERRRPALGKAYRCLNCGNWHNGTEIR